jgi:hypothetical protein
VNQKKEYSVSVAVPQADYVSLMSVPVCHELMEPYAMAFLTLVMINHKVSVNRQYNNRISYLVDKGIDRHHAQMDAAHTLMLCVEKNRDEGKFTGPITGDTDDNNFALQAADVIAWSYHRQIESNGLSEEFAPLMAIFKASQIAVRPDGAVYKPHISFPVPEKAILIFATLIGQWVNATGKVPTWDIIIRDSEQIRKVRGRMSSSDYKQFNDSMEQLLKLRRSERKAKPNQKNSRKR